MVGEIAAIRIIQGSVQRMFDEAKSRADDSIRRSNEAAGRAAVEQARRDRKIW